MKKLSEVMNLCGPSTRDHMVRVSCLAEKIGQKMGLPSKQVENIKLSGLIHDIGKVVLPPRFMTKTDGLSSDELKIVQSHPYVGFSISNNLDLPEVVRLSILQHHERLDGSGYPKALRQDQILIEAKVLAVADVVDAISSHRPYNPMLELRDALFEIKNKRGQCFDPGVVDACLSMFPNQLAISQTAHFFYQQGSIAW